LQGRKFVKLGRRHVFLDAKYYTILEVFRAHVNEKIISFGSFSCGDHLDIEP
jgi:hypothetical protein